MGPLAFWDVGFVGALNLILESRFPMFATWGPGQRFFYNDAFEAALVGKDVRLGEPIAEVFAESWPDAALLFQRALDGQATYVEDFRLPLVRNGLLEDAWWSFSYSPLRATDGTIGGVFGSTYETTRRFRAEKALRSSEAALRSVTDMAPGMLWRCDPSGRLLWVNPALKTYLGVDDIEGLSWDDRIHPEDIETAQAIHEVNQRKCRPFESQQRIRGADGHYRWFVVRARRVLDEEGGTLWWCGSASDIHDWRVAMDDLSERDEFFRDFSGSEATLLWMADVATRRVEALNPEAPAEWDIPPDGKALSWDDWAPAVSGDAAEHFRATFDAAAAGEMLQLTFTRTTKTGETRRYHATTFPIPGPKGRIGRVGGRIIDVSRKFDLRVYLIDPDLGRRTQLTQDLINLGVRVQGFSDAVAFDSVAADLIPGCVVVAVGDDVNATLRAASLISHGRARFPWIALDGPALTATQVVQLMKMGARDVITSQPAAEEIKAAAAALLAARSPGSPRDDAAEAQGKLSGLSVRERQVLEGLLAGGTNKSIAQTLKLSPRTVETHRAHLMDRVGATSLAELLGLAAKALPDPRRRSR